jgi:gamma-butyrobetaine dioxygenase
MDPHVVDFERMEEWYRAYNRFASIIRDTRFQYRALLESGDFLMYDNFRMLHARTKFTGARWLRGVYFDHQDVWKKIGNK